MVDKYPLIFYTSRFRKISPDNLFQFFAPGRRVMSQLEFYLTPHAFRQFLYTRVRLTCRYLELLLDCSHHEFRIEQPNVQQDWSSNVEALRWLAGPIYRLVAAFGAECGEANPALEKELRRHEGRLKAFHGLLCDVHEAYNSVDSVLKDATIVRSRHQHLQISLDFLVDVCNGWLREIVNPGDSDVAPLDEQVWQDSGSVQQWDGLTSLQDVPPDFEDLNSQVEKVLGSAKSLSDCVDPATRSNQVLALCMETRRLLLMLFFHFLTVRPAAQDQLRAAQRAFEAAEAAAEGEQESSLHGVKLSFGLLRQRSRILAKLASKENAGNCLAMIERTPVPELAEIHGA